MALRVHMPLTVRVTEPVGPGELGSVEAATDAAVTRAIALLDREVLAARGRHRRVRVTTDPPRFTGVAGDERRQADLARAVLAGVSRAVSAAPALRRPAVVTPDGRPGAGEPWHDARHDPSRGTYEVQFFDDGESADVPVLAMPVEESGEYHPPGIAAWHAWEGHLERNGAVAITPATGYPGFYGRVMTEADRDWGLFVITSATVLADGSLGEYEYRFVPFRVVDVRDPSRMGVLPPAGTGYVVTRGAPVTRDLLLARLTEIARSPGVVSEGPPPTEEQLAATADAIMARLPGTAAAMYTFTGAGRTEHVVFPGDVEAPVYAVTCARDMDLPGQEEGGSGTGGSTGTGTPQEGTGGEAGGTATDGREGGHPAGTDEEGGSEFGTRQGTGTGTRRWPTAGDGSAVTCDEPFDDEPALGELLEGAEELRARMRRLSGILALDPCEYAGRYALACSQVIGGYAAGVARLAARQGDARMTVTLRPDGAGNNGFVDMRPVDEPAVVDLRVLAMAVDEVDDFAQLVMDVYDRPGNRGLFGDHGAVSWNLHFLVEYTDVLPHSCMWLFAETCRVLLMQQLRATAQSLRNRSQGDGFEQTVQRFSQALDILGASVMRASTMRLALRHAARVGATGAVRSVLSQSELTYSPRTDSYHELPPPIDSVPADVVTALEDATVAREGGAYVVLQQGRRYTLADLDQLVGARRSMLNRVDPLFLQIDHLESVYARARSGGEAAVRTYLTDLFAELVRANTEMQAETNDPDDGAFFAVESSQWVEAEHGVDARGLKFQLQGIHRSADAVLAAATGGTRAYVVGVNLAIGRKAGWDRFVSTFSTIGIIALALVAAPLGPAGVAIVTGVAGLALAARDVADAERREDLYRALEDPEAVLSWQEVEMARIMATLSIVFAVFDVVQVGRGVTAGARAAIRSAGHALAVGERAGARMAVAAVTREARRVVLANMSEELLRAALRHAMSDLVIAGVLDRVLPALVAPALNDYVTSAAREHGVLLPQTPLAPAAAP